MSEEKETQLHREFELERMILFSDAVFAIAITLLIIEIKFPELPENFHGSPNLWLMFRPTLLHAMGFVVSFFFIGLSWAGHLKMFRYLKTYDNGVIALNLLCLFFIVTFPFTAAGLEHLKVKGFSFPLVIYLGNIFCVRGSNFLLARYIFRKKSELSVEGHEPQKKYIYLQAKATALALAISFAIVLITTIVTNADSNAISTSMYSLFFVMIPMRRWLNKQKPKEVKKLAVSSPD